MNKCQILLIILYLGDLLNEVEIEFIYFEGITTFYHINPQTFRVKRKKFFITKRLTRFIDFSLVFHSLVSLDGTEGGYFILSIRDEKVLPRVEKILFRAYFYFDEMYQYIYQRAPIGFLPSKFL